MQAGSEFKKMERNSILKMEMISDPSLEDGIRAYRIKQFPIVLGLPEDHEDACTQTESYCTKRVIPSQEEHFPSFESNEQLKIQPEGKSNAFTTALIQAEYFESPPLRKKTSQCHKNKTPNTVKVLMEKHRENERMRHHSLNERLQLICRQVPGSAEDGRETKVVMMQRIISYIAYLENTVHFICKELNIDTDPKKLPLTSSVSDIEKAGFWSKEFMGLSSDESKDSDVFSQRRSQRLKLSSPTIDSTTGSTYGDISPSLESIQTEDASLFGESQGASVPGSSFFIDLGKDGSATMECEDVMTTVDDGVLDDHGHLEFFLNDSQYDQAMFELPPSTFEANILGVPEEVKWLGSPDKSPYSSEDKREIGIKCDHDHEDDQSYDLSHTVIVSPNQILPQSAMKHKINMTANKDDVSKEDTIDTQVKEKSCDHACKNKRKQTNSRRTPLINIANWTEFPDEFHAEISNYDGWALGNGYDPPGLVGNFVEVESSANDLEVHQVPQNELIEASRSIVQDMDVASSSKLDLRRSSWMNGFMMYSRIHRKRFIKANPGIHTSAISKMMGQAWRGMNSSQQEPYKEQARICAHELQQLLDQSRQI